jgi:hypothetical protein
MSEEEIRRIDIKEFREFGYLQELNRQFLHPLGLALEVVVDDETGEESLGGIWDYRDDPEGIVFGEPLDGNKTIAVESEKFRHREARESLMGGTIQPLDWTPGND